MSLSTTHIFFMFVDEEKKSLVIWLGFQEILGLTLSQHSKRSEEASLYMHVSCSGQQQSSPLNSLVSGITASSARTGWEF